MRGETSDWQSSVRKAAFGVLAVMLAAAVGYAAGAGLLSALVALGAVLLMALCLAQPYLAAVLLVVTSFFVQWLIWLAFLPTSAKTVEDALAIAILVSVLMTGARRTRSWRAPPGTLWLLALMLAGIAAAVVGQQSISLVAISLRTVFRFTPLFLAPALLGWNDKRMRRLVWLIVGLCLVQAPISGVQSLVYSKASGDPMGGSLGANTSGTLTVLVIAIATLLAALWIYNAAPRPWLMVGLAALCVPPAVNETKVFFIAAPLILGTMVIVRIQRSPAAAIVLCGLLAVGVVGVAVSYSALYGRGRSIEQVSTTALREELSPGAAKGGELKRMTSLSFTVGTLTSEPSAMPFGFGAGSVVTSGYTGNSGSLVQRYGLLLRSPVFAVRLALEYGVAGLVCFLGLMVSVFRSALVLERRSPDPFWKAVGMGGQGLIVTMVAMSVYTSTFAADSLAAVFWCLAGVVVAQRVSSRRDSWENGAA